MKLSGYANKKMFNEGIVALEKSSLVEIVKEGGKEKYRLLDERFKKKDEHHGRGPQPPLLDKAR